MTSGSGTSASAIGRLRVERSGNDRPVVRHGGKVFAGELAPSYPSAPAEDRWTWLRHTPSGVVSRVDRQDAKEILAIPGTLYEPADPPEED